MSMKKVTDLKELRGKRVLLRASLNIPLKNGVIQNRLRLKRALPTMRYLREQGAKIIVLAHIGREPEETLRPIFDELERYLPLHWGGNVMTEGFRQRMELMNDGDILLAENLRQHDGEENNDSVFVTHLASLGEIYVNDAFAEAHREHASTYGVAKILPAYAGLTLFEEVTELKKVMQPKSPSLFLLGGAKFETKMPLVEKYLELYDQVFIGGALAHDIFKARGWETGKSLVSDVSLKGSTFLNSKKLLVPIDVIVEGPEGRLTKTPDTVTKDEKIFDCGPMTIAMLETYIEKAKTILWNGPFGAYEYGYEQSTEITARHIAAADAYSVLGGGDTVAAVEKMRINELFSFVSVGGGSMLTFLENGSTPVLDLLEEE
ncbi:phosphoglycerate kinase [Candidatus Kaiserbacteria bacterium]|nr:phosphoglycerate kinase [Candidatus Kaiserbacteria bacterium]NCT01679.1 phosphoglycerate kinase [Candidatus Parcubacteria bacterium]